MILVIDALNKSQFPATLDDVYKLRARIFGDRMGWDVNIEGGKEIDQFDDLDPAYVVSLDEEGRVLGTLRLLQTTGPNMLSDVFFSILDGEPAPRSALLWESTRFCVDIDHLKDPSTSRSTSYVTCELMIGGLEYCRHSGIEDIVTVVDPIMNRVLKRSGCPPYDYLGAQRPMGKVTALAALVDCSEDRIAEIRETAGIKHDVFASERPLSSQEGGSTAIADDGSCGSEIRYAEAGPDDVDDVVENLPDPKLRAYFAEQLKSASTGKAREDTLALLRTVKRRLKVTS